MSVQQPKTNIPVNGPKLKKLRMDRGLKQWQVEDQAGIPRGRLTQYENGRSDVPPDYLEKLLNFYGITGPEVITPSGIDDLTSTARRLIRLVPSAANV